MASFVGNQYLIYNKIQTLDEILDKYKNLKIDDVKNIANIISKEMNYLYYIK
jgi:hypothetical protein